MLKLGRKMLKNVKKTLKNNKGFTLLELIIVIAIMGFLVAMVAPRLEGIGSKASGTVDDGSTKVVENTLSRYINENNKLPDKLGSLVPAGAEAGEAITVQGKGGKNAFIWNGEKSRTAKTAVFDRSFEDKNKLFVHVLNEDEAKALKDFGVRNLVNGAGVSEEVAAGVKVMMIGGGAAGKDDTNKIADSIVKDDVFADPTLMYRIVVSISDESELITQGYMKKGSQSAVQGESERNIQNSGYDIVLPKLPQTFIRAANMKPITLEEFGKDGTKTGKKVTTIIANDDNIYLKDTLVMSPTGIIGTGNGTSKKWIVTDRPTS